MNLPNTLLACSALASAFAFVGSADAANVIANGSFEGTANWTGIGSVYNHPSPYTAGISIAGTGGAQSVAATGNYNFDSLTYGVNGTVSQPIGSQYHGVGEGTQIVSTSSLNAGASSAQIDGGNAIFSFSTWLTSWAGDGNTPALRLRFFDADNGTGVELQSLVLDRGLTANQITTAQLLATGSALNGAEDSTTDPDYWALYQATGTVPTGTRSAIVDFVAGTGHIGGGNNDWYADGVVLDIVPVPEPAVALLSGLGALGLLRRRRLQA